MVNLRCIAAAFADKPELTPGARAQANNDITGTIFLNGFAGLCMEWALLALAHFQEQVDDGCDNIVCTTHKTSHLYGNLSKWMAPGTIESMKCYAALPRPSDVTSFFVPATGSAEQGVGTFHIPPSLFRFGKKYLPDECTRHCQSADKVVPHGAHALDQNRIEAA